MRNQWKLRRGRSCFDVCSFEAIEKAPSWAPFISLTKDLLHRAEVLTCDFAGQRLRIIFLDLCVDLLGFVRLLHGIEFSQLELRSSLRHRVAWMIDQVLVNRNCV